MTNTDEKKENQPNTEETQETNNKEENKTLNHTDLKKGRYASGRWSKFKFKEVREIMLKCARQGLTFRATMSEVGMTSQNFDKLRAKDKRFADLHKEFYSELEKFYIKLGIALATGQITPKDGSFLSPSVYIWMTKSILKWGSKENLFQNLFEFQHKVEFKANFDSPLTESEVKKLQDQSNIIDADSSDDDF